MNRRDFLKGLLAMICGIFLPKLGRERKEKAPPNKAIWLCEHNAHQEIASIPKGGYVVPKHLEIELVSMLRSGGVVVGKPISIPLILEDDLISLGDEDVEP